VVIENQKYGLVEEPKKELRVGKNESRETKEVRLKGQSHEMDIFSKSYFLHVRCFSKC
jgi:hypothetical protein